MIRVVLSERQVEELEGLFAGACDRRLRDRAQIVLMAHRGRKHPEIAADTGTSPRSVQRWLNAYLDGGPDRLRPRKAKGASPKLTEDLAPTLRQWVIDGPAKQGLDRANWTHGEIADHLLKAKGIRTSRSAVQRFCSGIGIRLYRPTYRHERGDPAKQARAKETLADLGNGHGPGRSSC